MDYVVMGTGVTGGVYFGVRMLLSARHIPFPGMSRTLGGWRMIEGNVRGPRHRSLLGVEGVVWARATVYREDVAFVPYTWVPIAGRPGVMVPVYGSMPYWQRVGTRTNFEAEKLAMGRTRLKFGEDTVVEVEEKREEEDGKEGAQEWLEYVGHGPRPKPHERYKVVEEVVRDRDWVIALFADDRVVGLYRSRGVMYKRSLGKSVMYGGAAGLCGVMAVLGGIA